MLLNFNRRMKPQTVSYYVISGITLYRLLSAPVLFLLAMMGETDWFKWLVALSFLTDAIDGPLSRKYGVTSVFGARLDSVADDATVFVSIFALWFIDPEFFMAHGIAILALLGLFAIQTGAALIVYKRTTSFHTYLAKIAAVMQAVFFVTFFFHFGPSRFLFAVAAVITAVELMEEIILVGMLHEWRTDVKGLYWVLKERRHTSQKS